MPQRNMRAAISRRKLLKLGVGASLTGPFVLFPSRSASQQKRLTILQWNHPVPAYDGWFEETFARDWGRRNDTQVIVDHVSASELGNVASAEVRAGAGHDITMFLYPPANFEKSAIDHAEIYQEAQGRHGQVGPLAHKSTFNPASKRYFAFCDCYMPTTSNWLIPLWVQIGLPGGPNDYDTLRSAARQIKEQLGLPCGLFLGDSLEANGASRALLWSFGGTALDADGRIRLQSRETTEALKFVRDLFRESGTPEMLIGPVESATHAILQGKASYTMSGIGLTRHFEKSDPSAVKKIAVSPPPRGPHAWLSCPQVTSCYVVWKFSKNIEAAKHFLASLIDEYRAAFKASELCNMPSFPAVAPNLLARLRNDPDSDPPDKYLALEDALHWTRNTSFPAFPSAADTVVWEKFVIPRMFRRVAAGQLTPEQSLEEAQNEIAKILESQPRDGSVHGPGPL